MDPIIGGALISAAGSIFTNKKNRDHDARKIRMLANDARAAGIHPLAAMGQQSTYQGVNPLEGATGAGVAMAQRKTDRENTSIARDVANSEIKRNEAEAAKMVAEATAVTTNTRLQASQRGATTGGSVTPVYGAGLTLDGAAGSLDVPEASVEELIGYVRGTDGNYYPVFQDPETGVQVIVQQMTTGKIKAHNQRMEANNAPPKGLPSNPKLGQIHREGVWEYVFTRQGWRRRSNRGVAK